MSHSSLMSPDEIDLEIEQLEFKKDEWLRKKGWDQTSSTPGCIWLWKKQTKGWGQLFMNKESAISAQYWIDEFGDKTS